MKKLKPDSAVTQAYLAKVEAKLDIIDYVLSQHKYIAGDVSSFHFLSRAMC
jgi:hypothetical protein